VADQVTPWVTLDRGSWCSQNRFHRYKCVPRALFDEEVHKVGGLLEDGETLYVVCKVVECNLDCGGWFLVYAHYYEQPLSGKEWNDLYGPNVAC
jgi:hypothetical protein